MTDLDLGNPFAGVPDKKPSARPSRLNKALSSIRRASTRLFARANQDPRTSLLISLFGATLVVAILTDRA